MIRGLCDVEEFNVAVEYSVRRIQGNIQRVVKCHCDNSMSNAEQWNVEKYCTMLRISCDVEEIVIAAEYSVLKIQEHRQRIVNGHDDNSISTAEQ